MTGGAGFIGLNFIWHVLNERPGWKIVNLDALTYAGNPRNLEDMAAEAGKRYLFVHEDIQNGLGFLFQDHNSLFSCLSIKHSLPDGGGEGLPMSELGKQDVKATEECFSKISVGGRGRK